MNETVKLGLILLIITAVAAAVLGVSNAITAERIAELDKITNNQAMQEVLGDAESFKLLDESKLKEVQSASSNIVEVNEGYDASSNLVGYTIKAYTTGYGGRIDFMLGISVDGQITGIKVISHSETPGLGANAEKSYFTDSFKGKSASQELTYSKSPKADNEVQAITSATKTTKGIVEGVNKVLEAYNAALAN
ncbi:MAG TPA: RnfABCDGE type electron transport complex subunit G [Tissierellia bacterium]|nr:RnfABCDGE type electron transport complex subunit G [Tissierellia bacterium]